MIDIHTHLHPPRLFAAIRRWFAEHSTWDLSQPTEPDLVAQVLKAHGVERFVYCSYAHKPGMARTINEWLIQIAAQLGGFGLPLATVHLADNDYIDYYREALENGSSSFRERLPKLALRLFWGIRMPECAACNCAGRNSG
jgi:uncharacterized protein